MMHNYINIMNGYAITTIRIIDTSTTLCIADVLTHAHVQTLMFYSLHITFHLLYMTVYANSFLVQQQDILQSLNG